MAETFAKSILCQDKSKHVCGKCISCVTFDSGNNPDVIFLDYSDKKSIGVEEIRDKIGKNIELKPYLYPYKIFIITGAEKMTIQAQNALLKTIEEPPEYGVFLIISNNISNFLLTILSRCMLIRMETVKNDEVKKYLIEKKGFDYDKAELYAEFSQGNIGQAIEISSSEDFSNMRNDILDLLCKLDEKGFTDMFKLVDKLLIYKENIQKALDIAFLFYRDAAVFKAMNGESKYCIQKDKIESIYEIALNKSLKSLIKKADIVLDTKVKLKQNANFQMAAEVMLLNLKEKQYG